MKRIAALLLILTAGLPLAARADLCALDHAPAATLLLPYFEVDLSGSGGKTTLFSINNAVASPVIAHVTLWTDLGVPTLAFDVYLTGYDVQTINLRDILANGQLPQTADKDRDPADTISPKGGFSQDAAFPGCESLPPPVLPAAFVDHLQRAHSGQASPVFQGKCSGLDFHQPGVERGYVTIDVVKSCTLLRPSDPGYFGPNGVAGFDNVLWGDFFYVDPTGRFAQGDNLVRIEADPNRFSAGGVTFYGRYVNGSGADGREPLATSWATRYLIGGPFDGGTDLVAWREVPWAASPFPCTLPPTAYPQSESRLIVFDEQEHPEDLLLNMGIPGVPHPIPAPFGGAATRVTVGGHDLPTPYDFGWAWTDVSSGSADPYAQGWVGQVSSSQGRYSVGFQGTHLNSLCATAADRCPGGQAVDAGQLCVGPTQAGQPAHFTVTPKGCFSSSCTLVVHAGCAVQDNGLDLQLDALVCLGASPTTGPCTSDCNGGGSASCDSGPLAAGNYTAHLGGLNLNVTVPSATGACVSSP